jgi:hypothetical protein
MVAHPLAIGGFLWAFADEAVVRTDKGGALDTDGNHAADGIVGPYREKEGSFYAIKEIWAPVYLPAATLDRLPATWDGRLRVENRYDFIDLADVRFAWKLVAFRGPGDARAGHEVRAQGIARAPKVPPRAAGELALALPADWRTHDALALTATDPDGREIWTWTWMLATPEELAKRLVRGDAAPVEATLDGGKLRVQAGDAEATFDLATGQLVGATRAGKAFRLGRGPRLVGGKAAEPAPKVEHRREGADHVVEAIGTGTLKRVRWRVLPSGWLRLDYAYAPKGDPHEHLGVTFDLPDTAVTGMTWLGRGPYRVWKNRTHGVPFDVWRKPYNDTVTGETWQYPEFKGFHADLHWARLDTDGGPITVVSASKEIYLRVLTPRFPGSAHHAAARFPEGDLSFLHGITPIGTKFRRPEEHGPAGGPNLVGHRKSPYEGTIYLRFGEAPREARAE